jgi:hypothetical protein
MALKQTLKAVEIPDPEVVEYVCNGLLCVKINGLWQNIVHTPFADKSGQAKMGHSAFVQSRCYGCNQKFVVHDKDAAPYEWGDDKGLDNYMRQRGREQAALDKMPEQDKAQV